MYLMLLNSYFTLQKKTRQYRARGEEEADFVVTSGGKPHLTQVSFLVPCSGIHPVVVVN